MSTSSLGTDTVAAGVDLGSLNARVATYDASLNHPVLVHNHDGHRTTKVVFGDANEPVTAETLKEFYQKRLLQLATDAAHTKDLLVVTSVPHSSVSEEWLQILQNFGGVITESAAVCLAYQDDLPEPNGKTQRILVVDGGASALKATILSSTSSSGLWVEEESHKLDTVHGQALIDSLAQSVAQQFEQKHRFPRGEVWESKKARRKLNQACESGLKTLQINNTSAMIHVDGLYEGMDCQVSISKPKWEHLSSKLVYATKQFLQPFLEKDIHHVVLSGNLHTWLKPIVKSIFADKLLSSSPIDPSEAIALGCTKHAYFILQQQEQEVTTSTDASQIPPTLEVPTAPVAIGVTTKEDEEPIVMIDQGTPLPTIASLDYAGGEGASMDIWQLQPTHKKLATLQEDAACSLKLQLSATGQLRISVNGESIIIG